MSAAYKSKIFLFFGYYLLLDLKCISSLLAVMNCKSVMQSLVSVELLRKENNIHNDETILQVYQYRFMEHSAGLTKDLDLDITNLFLAIVGLHNHQ